jgi:cytidylate kinase
MGYQIAIDGPASSGKSTIAKLVAKELNYTYINTGAMYRAICYYILDNNLSLDDNRLEALIKTVDIDLDGDTVYLNGEDVSEVIRGHEVTNNVSAVSMISFIRQILVKKQQEIAAKRDVVMDGRDIGTVVLTDADLKIFMVADVIERAKRRYKDNMEKGIPTDFDRLVKEIEERDYIDSNREISPLKQADDAVLVDTTNMSIAEVAKYIKSLIK